MLLPVRASASAATAVAAAVAVAAQSSHLHLGDERGFEPRNSLDKLANLKHGRLTLTDRREEPVEEKQARDSGGRFIRKQGVDIDTPPSPSLSSVSSLPPVTPQSHSPDKPTPSDLPALNTVDMAPTPEEKLFRGDYSAGEKPHIWF